MGKKTGAFNLLSGSGGEGTHEFGLGISLNKSDYDDFDSLTVHM